MGDFTFSSMVVFVVCLALIFLAGCSTSSKPDPYKDAVVRYVDRCTAEVGREYACKAFPGAPAQQLGVDPSMVGAFIGAAEAVAPLLLPAAAAKQIVE